MPKGYLALFYGGSVSANNSFPRTFLEVGGIPRIRLDRIGDRVSVSLDLFDSDPNPRIIATVEKNHFTVNPNNYFRLELSRDHSRLTITDQHNVKALSLDYLNKGALRIDAVLYYPGMDGPLRITDNELITPGGGSVSHNCFHDSAPDIAEIDLGKEP